MDAKVQYATADDGVRIAFSIEGAGPPLLVAPEFVAAFSLEYMVPAIGSFRARMGAGRSVVRYDLRGTGLSDAYAGRVSLDQLAADMLCVADAAGLERFDHFAADTAGPIALTFAAKHPHRMRRLALYGTLRYEREMAPQKMLDAFVELVRSNWEMASWTIGEMGGSRPTHPAYQPDAGDDGPGGMGALYFKSARSDIAARILEACVRVDLRPLLPLVPVETLVLHKRGDIIFPFEGGRRLAADLPHATFLPLAGNVNAAFGHGDERVVDPVREFFDQPDRAAPEQEPAPMTARLSAREREILQLVAGGRSNREISEHLVLSERTVARHIANIYTKIGAHGRAEATAYAFRHGLR